MTPSTTAPGPAAGLDVGGTKIEARLFAADWSVLASREIATPLDDYDAFLTALARQIGWLHAQCDDPAIPTGIGLPGVVDQRQGTILTANLPASGKPLLGDLVARLGGARPVMINDSKAFALSEALLGAGQGHETVLSVILGTGIAGGLVHRGALLDGANRVAGEFGHAPISATALARHDLPVLRCGCGRMGCYETFCSGVGLERLAHHLTGQKMDARDIARRAGEGSRDDLRLLSVWMDLLTDLLVTLCFTVDPGCVVLGGGASQVPGLTEVLSRALVPKLLTGMAPPEFRLAAGGPRSGARGAALAAVLARQGE